MKNIKKILTILLLLFITISVVFFIMHSIPNGPSIINNANIDQSVKDSFNAKYGLDKPLYIQLLLFWKNIFTGNLGASLSVRLGKEINDFIWPKFWQSLLIGGIASTVGIGMGIGIGILIGIKPRGGFDKTIQILIAVFIAVPPFILSLIFILSASSIGIGIIFERGNPLTWVLPILSIAIPSSMVTAKFMRTRLLAALDTQYARLAISKGVTPYKVISRHLLKESLYTIATSLPTAIIMSIISSILIENMFSIPGMGRLYTAAIQTKDYNVVLAITTLMVILTSISFMVRDALYIMLNPRLRKAKGA